jgi:hypothetical protein
LIFSVIGFLIEPTACAWAKISGFPATAAATARAARAAAV